MKQKGNKAPKMGDMQLKCPLCCDKTFNSKPALKEHLNNILLNKVVCPICKNKWSSLADLIQHLSLESCRVDNAVSPMKTESDQKSVAVKDNAGTKPKIKKLKDSESLKAAKNNLKDSKSAITDPVDGGSSTGGMYVEFLGKQELKVVKEGDVNRYVLLANEDSPLKLDGSSKVVTKQNNDGTISLTAVEDVKKESVNSVRPEIPEVMEEEGEEIYTCNTCGISFTSVLDHIQNYHNDQDVVVEERLDSVDSPSNQMAMEQLEDPLYATEGTANHKSGPRRMITETGDIVEEPVYIKNATIALEESDPEKGMEPQIKEEVVDKLGRTYTRRYVVVEKKCDPVVKDIKPPPKKSGPYHKVVIKEVEAANGEEMRVFHCLSCNAYVTNLDEFKSRPCKQLKYTCPHCPVAYENHRSLCAHMKVHKIRPDDINLDTPRALPVPPPTQVECEVCNTQFQTHKSLKLHRRMHDPVKARPIELPVEGVNGGKVSSDQFLCSVCDKLIPMDYRKIHVASHRDIQEFHCDVCNKRFNSRSYLEMHMSVHSAEKTRVDKEDKSLQYKCLYCQRRFARPHEKVKHERIHTGEKPHSCEICGKSFRVSYCLTLHMRTHTGARPYECAHCGKRFKAHSVYNHHLLTHSDVRAYKCSFCPKAFKTSVQLAGHKNSHTKPFSCQYCNRPFASLYAVRIHTETHKRANNLKFSCTLCGASYARAFALKDHMKAAHTTETENADQMDTSEKETEWVTPDVVMNIDDTAQLKGMTNEDDISELAVTIANDITAIS